MEGRRRGVTSAMGWLFFGLCFLSACASKPYKETGFVGDYSHMVQTKNYHRFYADPRADFKSYKNVVIKPVNTAFLPDFKWYDERYNEIELRELVTSMQDQFAEELGKSYLINPPAQGGKTLVLELALVKLAPVDAVSNVLSTAVIMMPVSKGEVAIEGRVTDASNGKVLMRFTDARKGKESLVNVKDFDKFAHAEVAIGEWARELHDIMKLGEAERAGYFGGNFELKVWK
jgi:hypothetical protein